MSEIDLTGETDLDIDELIELIFSSSNREKHGPELGRITSITEAPNFVDVQPLIGKIVGGQPRIAPILQSVPIAWPGSAKGRITWGLAIGDKVELLPQAGDLSNWINSEAETPSSNTRSLSLSDVIALPLTPSSKLSPLPAAAYSPSAAVFYAASLLLLGDNTAVEFVALAPQVVTEIQFVRDTSDAHIHTTPAGNSGPPTVLFSTLDPVGDCAAEKVKAK